MPVYSFKCPTCLTRFDRVLRLANYQEPQTCECGSVAVKQLCAPAIRGDYAGYSCPVTGQWVEGRKAHQENLRRHGCRVLETGETEAVAATRAREEAAFDRVIENTTEEFIAGLPAVKKDQLASEMQAGVTATVVRQ